MKHLWEISTGDLQGDLLQVDVTCERNHTEHCEIEIGYIPLKKRLKYITGLWRTMTENGFCGECNNLTHNIVKFHTV